jgi:hypothetical protein
MIKLVNIKKLTLSINYNGTAPVSHKCQFSRTRGGGISWLGAAASGCCVEASGDGDSIRAVRGTAKQSINIPNFRHARTFAPFLSMC